MIRRVDVIEGFFSGGRDSALACYIGFRVARVVGKPFRLVFIDTKTGLEETREYVLRYARWLGVELKILRTRYDYWELVDRWGYPFLWNHRWCIDFLKLSPLLDHLFDLYRQGVKPLWVMGIRQSESRFRVGRYHRILYQHSYRRRDGIVLHTWIWQPILHLRSYQVDRLIDRFGIPRSPVWRKLGISGECLCLAGSTRKMLDLLRIHYPGKVRELIERDRWIQSRRRTREAYSPPLYHLKLTLSDYLQGSHVKTLDSYTGKCQCLVERDFGRV